MRYFAILSGPIKVLIGGPIRLLNDNYLLRCMKVISTAEVLTFTEHKKETHHEQTA